MRSSKFNRRGMTLVEILIASTIGLIALTVALRFVVQILKSYQYETGKIMVNRDIRKFTAQMVDDATYANSFMIFDQRSNLTRGSGNNTVSSGGSTDPLSSTYKGYTTDLVRTDPDDTATPVVVGTERVESGLPGDVVVFIYNVNGDNTKIYQLIIYYRTNATTANGTDGTNSTTVSARTCALRRIVVSIYDDGTTSTTSNPIYFGIWRLMPDLTQVTTTNDANGAPQTMSAKNTTIFPYVDGQANDLVPTGSTNRSNKMFYNMNNTSVLIRGRIYENYTAQRLVKSTYNFTVTPRG